MPPTTSSRALTLQKITAMVYGPPDRSKTFSSLTLSDRCPADLTHVRPKTVPQPPRNPVDLDDMLWFQMDDGATTGMAEQGISVPVIDISGVAAQQLPQELADGVRQAKERSVELTKAGRRLKVVIDTVSALDRKLQYYVGEVLGLTEFNYFRALLQHHTRFAHPFKEIGCDFIALCHAKAIMDLGTGTAGQQQKRRLAAAGAGDIIPDITGQALGFYRGDVTFTFAMHRKTETHTVQGKPQALHAYYFRAADPTFEAKTRMILPPEMPADWRVVRRLVGGGQ